MRKCLKVARCLPSSYSYQRSIDDTAGPSPRKALSLIDRLNLYDTIFTDPNQDMTSSPNLENWHKAYELLAKITGEPKDPALRIVRSILIPTNEDAYRSWLLCAIVPWVPFVQDAKSSNNLHSATNTAPVVAVHIAREGLKIEKKSTSIIKNGVLHLGSIIHCIETCSDVTVALALSGKRKHEPSVRETLGMQIRGWGTYWRNGIMLAMLVQAVYTEGETGMGQVVLDSNTFSSSEYRTQQVNYEVLEFVDAIRATRCIRS